MPGSFPFSVGHICECTVVAHCGFLLDASAMVTLIKESQLGPIFGWMVWMQSPAEKIDTTILCPFIQVKHCGGTYAAQMMVLTPWKLCRRWISYCFFLLLLLLSTTTMTKKVGMLCKMQIKIECSNWKYHKHLFYSQQQIENISDIKYMRKLLLVWVWWNECISEMLWGNTTKQKARKITGAKKKQLDWVQKGDLTEAVSQK